MTAWVKGEPDPDMPVKARRFDAEDRLESFEQAGWRIEFARFRDRGGRWLPGRIDVHRTGTRIRLLIAHWELALEQI
jgi:outer membrane lipoprotein LolB